MGATSSLPSLIRQDDIHESPVTAIALGCDEPILPHAVDQPRDIVPLCLRPLGYLGGRHDSVIAG